MGIWAHIEVVPELLLLLGAASLVIWHKAHYHFRVVEAGRLYRSGAMGRLGLWWIWRRYGIRTIVNLTTERECRKGVWYQREERFCRKKGIELVHLPMLQGVAPDARQIGRFLEVSLSEERQPVLVHCKQGVARTNIMVAVYLKERFGRPNEEILRELPSFGHWLGGPRYDTMREFVLKYKAEENGGDPASWTNPARAGAAQIPGSGE